LADQINAASAGSSCWRADGVLVLRAGCAEQTALTLHCLGLAGYEVYHPCLRVYRRSYGRKIEVHQPLFVGYCFVSVVSGWWNARWAPGVVRIVLDGTVPAKVPDSVIAEIRSRECGGLVELPQPRELQAGDRVRVSHGPFAGHLAIFAGMKPHERVEVLLALLGGQQRVTLPKGDVAAV
jgi:transcriptional antiterminator RfaH